MSAVPDISKLSLADKPKATAKARPVPVTDNLAGPGPDSKSAVPVPDDELERFRREWKEEVARKAPAADGKGKGDKGEKEKEKDKERERVKEDAGEMSELARVLSSTSTASTGRPQSPTKQPTSPSKVAAQLPPSPTKATAGKAKAKAKSPATTTSALPIKSPLSSRVPLPPQSSLSTSPTKIPFRAPQVRKDRDGAVGVYSRAVEAEQSGRLNDALKLYRQAFKMEDNVDKLYARFMAKRAEQIAAEQEEDVGPGVGDVVDPSAPDVPEFAFRRHIQVHPDHEGQEAAGQGGKMSKLTAMIVNSEAAAHAQFMPDDEELPVPIARLPAELLEPVLSHLDVASIEAFAATCWRARRITAYTGAWRRIVQQIYRPPMVPKSLTPRELARRHHGEWRTVLVEEERVRLDGCYISVCHYVRPGAGEEWIAITHMITYHRFLRFYADGSVISFLTTDHPHDVVPLLNPNLRGKGLHFGRWRLVRSDAESDEEEEEDSEGVEGGDAGAETEGGEATDVNGTNGTDVNVKRADKKIRADTAATATNIKNTTTKGKDTKRARILITDLVEPGADEPKYEFEMDIALRETNRGRWNKLDLARYSTINLRTGEVLHLSLRHQKPFYFSKVRSWSPQL